MNREGFMVKVYTTNIKKGGVGKTTITFNAAFYLSEKQNKRVLLIDLDDSCNLTKRFQDYYKSIPDTSTVKMLFTTHTQKIVPIVINDKINLIAGYDKLPLLIKDVQEGKGRGYLMEWFYQNKNELEKRYDYILIDTHNDFSIFTDNALVLADKILAIADIDEDAIEKLHVQEVHMDKLKKAYTNPMNGESFVKGNLIKVGNKVQTNTADSHLFRSAFENIMANDPSFLGYFEFRTPFAKAKTTRKAITELEEMKQYQTPSYRKFFDRTYNLFEKIFK